MVHDLDFGSLENTDVKVTGPDKKKYVLREATGAVAAKYRNACMACMKLTPDGKSAGIQGLADVEPLLVSMCLFTEEGSSVELSLIKAWPAKVVKKLFETAQEISDLKEQPKEERKLLDQALSNEVAPCNLAQLRKFVGSLSDDYKPLKDFLAPTTEELAKNEQSGTTGG